MSLLKGQKSGGYLRVNQDVLFLKNLVSRYCSPWSASWFVDGENGADTNSGQVPTDPLLTVQAAVTKAGRGDSIFVRPEHYTIGTGFSRYEEDVSVVLGGAGGLAAHATKADISLIGVTNSLNPEFGPRIKFATTQCLLVDAPSFHVENMGFFAESATYAIYLRNNGATYTQRGTDGFTMYNCIVKGSGLYAASGGDGAVISRTRFHTMYDGTSGGIGHINISCSANPGNRFKIEDCEFYGGNVTTTPVSTYITVAPPMNQLQILRCYFGLIPTSAKYVVLTGCQGIMSGCFFGDADVHLTNDLTLGSVLNAGNWDASGALIA